ncbi:MAG: hypothetical protein ACPHUD_11185, partial [Porticoccaceae bacterium]
NGVGTISVDNGGHMTFDTGSSGAGQAERMRIDSSGNVGIGTSSPARTLEVYSTAPAIKLNNGTNAFTIGTGAFVDGSNSLVFFDEGVGERMRIDSSGNVGIGTNSPSQKLTIGFADNGTDGISFRSSTYANLAKILVQNETSTQNGNLQFHTRSGGDTNEAMRIDSNGNVGIGTSSPRNASGFVGL